MRRIDYIVIHCSATREGHVLTPEALDREHRRRGYRMTGYHYYIRRDGTTVVTRPLELAGAHVKGYNKHSIGICYEGGLDAQGQPKDTQRPRLRTPRPQPRPGPQRNGRGMGVGEGVPVLRGGEGAVRKMKNEE